MESETVGIIFALLSVGIACFLLGVSLGGTWEYEKEWTRVHREQKDILPNNEGKGE